MRRPKSRPSYVPEDTWEQCKHLLLVCDKHRTWVLGGVCSLCHSPDYMMRERGARPQPDDPYAEDEA